MLQEAVSFKISFSEYRIHATVGIKDAVQEEFPGHLCLAVDHQGKELLIPYAPALIKNIDHIQQQMTLMLPQDFLEVMGF